jgi:hypothetical protein
MELFFGLGLGFLMGTVLPLWNGLLSVLMVREFIALVEYGVGL